MTWFVYMLCCADDTYYTGVTTDIKRRLLEHNGEGGMDRGAKYTKARRPVRLVYEELAMDRSRAQQREAALRRLTRTEKIALAKAQKI